MQHKYRYTSKHSHHDQVMIIYYHAPTASIPSVVHTCGPSHCQWPCYRRHVSQELYIQSGSRGKGTTWPAVIIGRVGSLLQKGFLILPCMSNLPSYTKVCLYEWECEQNGRQMCICPTENSIISSPRTWYTWKILWNASRCHQAVHLFMEWNRVSLLS